MPHATVPESTWVDVSIGRPATVMPVLDELQQRLVACSRVEVPDSLSEQGIDTSNATDRMVAGVLASLAELELALGRERRSAAREARRARGQSVGRPKALSDEKVALAQADARKWRVCEHHR